METALLVRNDFIRALIAGVEAIFLHFLSLSIRGYFSWSGLQHVSYDRLRTGRVGCGRFNQAPVKLC